MYAIDIDMPYVIFQLTNDPVKFRPSFLESRRVGLEYFLKWVSRLLSSYIYSNVIISCVLLNPEFSGSPIVKDFLFGRTS